MTCEDGGHYRNMYVHVSTMFDTFVTCIKSDFQYAKV